MRLNKDAKGNEASWEICLYAQKKGEMMVFPLQPALAMQRLTLKSCIFAAKKHFQNGKRYCSRYYSGSVG